MEKDEETQGHAHTHPPEPPSSLRLVDVDEIGHHAAL